MQRREIEKQIERIFCERWQYDGGDPEYFADKRQSIESLACELELRVAHRVRVAVPANLQNFYRLEFCLTPSVDESHDAVSLERINECVEITYLTLSFSVMIPVLEGRWRKLQADRNGIQQKFCDLLDPAWLTEHPDFQTIAATVLELAELHRIDFVEQNVFAHLADPEWPVPPFPGDMPATLRAFVFPGICD